MNSRNLVGPTSEVKAPSSDLRDLHHPIADHHLSSVNQQFILFDYWRVLVKRGWVIVGVLVFALAVAGIISLRTTPLYRAAGEITIDKENANPLGLKENGAANDYEDLSVDLATQVRILKSNSLALLAARKLQSGAQAAGASNGSDIGPSASLTDPSQADHEQQDHLAGSFK